MLIALFGAPGAGKDTVAKRLVGQHGFVRVAFADKVRELAYETLPVHARDEIDKKGWDACKRMADNFYREHLERVGDGARKVLGDDVWINAVGVEIGRLIDSGKSVVITDMRKESESEFVCDYARLGVKSTMWHVTRPGCEKRPFDEWKPEWAAFTIHNNDSIEVLNQRVDEVLEFCQ
jgi:hypothetical protein